MKKAILALILFNTCGNSYCACQQIENIKTGPGVAHKTETKTIPIQSMQSQLQSIYRSVETIFSITLQNFALTAAGENGQNSSRGTLTKDIPPHFFTLNLSKPQKRELDKILVNLPIKTIETLDILLKNAIEQKIERRMLSAQIHAVAPQALTDVSRILYPKLMQQQEQIYHLLRD